MEINIEDEETLQLAREIAELTGETMEEAITVALRDMLETIKSQNIRKSMPGNSL